MTLEQEFEELLESLEFFEDLSTRLYSITEGDLCETRYVHIYGNFENVVKNHFIEHYPQHEQLLKNYFSTFAYDIALTGSTWLSNENRYIKTVSELIDYLDNKEGETNCEIE